jgi:hypothetical protein
VKKLRWFLAILAVPAVLVFVRPFSSRWVLEMEPTGEHLGLRVRLSTDRHFRYETRVEGNWSHLGGAKTVVLGLYPTDVPGGEVIFSDTTFLPGAFRLRFADKILAIQENGIRLIEQ